jgi:predicted small secreted protein
MKRIIFMTLLTAVFTAGLMGCEKEGPAETAGKKLDETVEKAGEKIEQAADEVKEKTEN